MLVASIETPAPHNGNGRARQGWCDGVVRVHAPLRSCGKVEKAPHLSLLARVLLPPPAPRRPARDSKAAATAPGGEKEKDLQKQVSEATSKVEGRLSLVQAEHRSLASGTSTSVGHAGHLTGFAFGLGVAALRLLWRRAVRRRRWLGADGRLDGGVGRRLGGR